MWRKLPVVISVVEDAALTRGAGVSKLQQWNTNVHAMYNHTVWADRATYINRATGSYSHSLIPKRLQETKLVGCSCRLKCAWRRWRPKVPYKTWSGNWQLPMIPTPPSRQNSRLEKWVFKAWKWLEPWHLCLHNLGTSWMWDRESNSASLWGYYSPYGH